MNKRHCLKVAGSIHTLLLREFGQGIEPERMLAEPLYARDVLLVCEALPGSELSAQAGQFRQAMLDMTAEHDARGSPPSGFSPSRFFNSIFGRLGK